MIGSIFAIRQAYMSDYMINTS